MAEKKLLRSTTDKKLLGVCGGVAKYFDIDPTTIRIIWALVSIFGGSGIIAYLVFAIIMPEENSDDDNRFDINK